MERRRTRHWKCRSQQRKPALAGWVRQPRVGFSRLMLMSTALPVPCRATNRRVPNHRRPLSAPEPLRGRGVGVADSPLLPYPPTDTASSSSKSNRSKLDTRYSTHEYSAIAHPRRRPPRTLREQAGKTQLWVEAEADLGTGYLQ